MQFSSFDPDVCAMLRARQQRIPVFFLSAGRAADHPNPARRGLDAAINFALRTNLQVLFAASLLQTCLQRFEVRRGRQDTAECLSCAEQTFAQ